MMRKESVLANLEKVEEVASLAVNKMAQAQGNRPTFHLLNYLNKNWYHLCLFLIFLNFLHQ
jgi:hypothetical protein